MGVALLAIFILPDFPNTTRWLSPEERRLAEVRMAEVSRMFHVSPPSQLDRDRVVGCRRRS